MVHEIYQNTRANRLTNQQPNNIGIMYIFCTNIESQMTWDDKKWYTLVIHFLYLSGTEGPNSREKLS